MTYKIVFYIYLIQYPRMENSSIQTRTTSLKLFTNLTNQMKYVTIQIEHPDEDKQENNTSGADRTVNDVFKSKIALLTVFLISLQYFY